MEVIKEVYDWYNNLKAEDINEDLIIATIALTGWGHGATDEVVGYSMSGGVDENDKETEIKINNWINTESNSRDFIQAALDDGVELKQEKRYAVEYEQLKNIDENGEPVYQVMVLINSHAYDGKPIIKMAPLWVDFEDSIYPGVDNEDLALFTEEEFEDSIYPELGFELNDISL